MVFERFWRKLHHVMIKGAGPLFLLVGVFLIYFELDPGAMAFFGQEATGDAARSGGGGVLSFALIGVVAGLFVLCPLISLIFLRRAQHRRGLIVLFPPLAMSVASLSAWVL